MAISQYNFSLQAKVRQGGLIKFPCICLPTDDDAKATAIKNWLHTNLENNAKTSIARQIYKCPNEELTSPATIKDVADFRMRYRYQGAEAIDGTDKTKQSEWVNVTFPGLKVGASTAELIALIKAQVVVKCFDNVERSPNCVEQMNMKIYNCESTDTSAVEQVYPPGQ